MAYHHEPHRAAPSNHVTRSATSGGWPEDRVELLRSLWLQGDQSASEIAGRLGVTRNAVLGKVHRLGLCNRRASAGPRPSAARTPRPSRRPRAPKAVAPPPTPKAPPRPEIGPGLVARLEDLQRNACHWPVGDPTSEAFRFCGRAAARPPYCEAHRGVAYKPGGPQPVTGLIRLFARG